MNQFWFCEDLWFIRFVCGQHFSQNNIIKHLVKSSSTAELTAAGKPLEIVIVA